MSMADGEHREVQVGGPASYSSSPELSSPPKSPESPSVAAALATATHPNADPHSGNSTIQVKIGGGVEKVASVTTTTTTTGHTLAKNNAITTNTAAPKRVRKKKDPGAAANGSSTTATEGKDTKPKKPRTQPSTSTAARKKQKTEASSTTTKTTATGASRQSKLTDVVGASHNSNSTITLGVPPRFASPQNGNSDAIPKPSLAFVAAGQPTPSSRSSGQNYDPIRSTTTEAPPVAHNPFSAPPVSPTPPRTANRASASPSIASLIDPPIITKPTPPIPFSHLARQPSSNVATPTPAPPSPQKASISPSSVQAQQLAPTIIGESPPQTLPDQPMRLDVESDCLPLKAAPKKVAAGASTGQSSSAASPKPARRKDGPRALPPPGNGLLSSALFGGPGDFSVTGTENTAPTVILHIPMNGETNKYINFARLAEERYGFNALHPRLAAQRERLARIAAAGAALERGSGSGSADEMSVDLSEGESNVEMGGVEGGSAAEGKKPVKKKQKADQYDKDDPFVDDSELLWEEQAAASKDGFFVYSGPLVPEGEKPTIERADGTVKRGRGRGRAGTARGTTTNRGGAAGGASTARGTTATRKPRVTKAARALMEQEKIDREKMAVLAAKPSTYPG